jgi:hypothetical protein
MAETGMNWTGLLKAQIESTYRATEGILALVDDENLDWRPETGHNWMSTAQLLKHIPTACGACMKGFVTGDWGMPGGEDVSEMSADEMLPPADKLPKAKSVAESRKELAADKKLALEMVAKAGEKSLASQMVAAPWNPTPRPLGQQLLEMVGHLAQHKGQLFYYLKLQGKPVHTGTLYGM